MTTPAITLLIPCYNAGKFLPRLLKAVAAQTVPFASILCYDDGSTDDTAAVANSLGLKIVVGKGNRGVAYARNRLVDGAATEWIHFHDADDLIAPRYVERLAPWCGEGFDIVSCDADWVDEISREPLLRWRYNPEELSRAALSHLIRQPMGLNNSVIRKSAWSLAEGCDESLAIWEDADVHIRMARSGARFHHVPEVLTWSLRRQDSFSHNHLRGWRCRLTALKKYADWPPVADISKAIEEEAERAAVELISLGDSTGATEALQVCRKAGGSPPTTRNPMLRLLKPWLPSLWILRMQSQWRRRA